MNQKKQNAKNLLALRLVVEMMGCINNAYFGENRGSANTDCVLLCAAVAIGEFEGRPMSASKLSEYVGMPRASVMRRLSYLESIGVIERPSTRSYVISDASMQRIQESNALGTMLRTIRKVSTELSRLDS